MCNSHKLFVVSSWKSHMFPTQNKHVYCTNTCTSVCCLIIRKSLQSLAALDALIAEAEERMYDHSRNRHRNDRRSDRRSPEQSFKFQKPSDRDRHHRRDKCNVSSTRRNDKDRKKTSPSRSFGHDRDPSPRRMPAERLRDARQPAWKKAKPIAEAKMEPQGN